MLACGTGRNDRYFEPRRSGFRLRKRGGAFDVRFHSPWHLSQRTTIVIAVSVHSEIRAGVPASTEQWGHTAGKCQHLASPVIVDSLTRAAMTMRFWRGVRSNTIAKHRGSSVARANQKELSSGIHRRHKAAVPGGIFSRNGRDLMLDHQTDEFDSSIVRSMRDAVLRTERRPAGGKDWCEDHGDISKSCGFTSVAETTRLMYSLVSGQQRRGIASLLERSSTKRVFGRMSARYTDESRCFRWT